MIRFYLLSLLVSVAFAIETKIDCSSAQNSCFGSPRECDPEETCQFYFHFDKQGNLDVVVKNFLNQEDYVAITLRNQPGVVTEYLICIPHQGKRLRAFAGPGQSIHVVEQHMAQYIQKLPENSFVCSFLANELSSGFRNQSDYSISFGQFSEDMIMPASFKLYNINPDIAFLHKVSATVSNQDFMMTPDESKMTTDLLGRLDRISTRGSQNDLDLESMLDDKTSKEEEETDLSGLLNPDKKFQRPKKKQDYSREKEGEELVEDSDKFTNNNQMHERKGGKSEEEESEEDYRPKPRRNRPTLRTNNNGNGRQAEDSAESEYETNSETDHDFVFVIVPIILAKIFVHLFH